MTGADWSRDFKLEALAFYGHCLPALVFWTITLSIPSWLSIDALTPVTSPLCLVSAIVMFLSLFHTYVPDPDCHRCDQARGRNPQAVADRQTWTLWFDHQLNIWPTMTWVALISGVVLTNMVVWVTGVTLFYIPLDLAFALMCWSTWRHFLLSPWCVYCRSDGGWDDGEHERIPDPEPVGWGAR